MFKRSIVLLGMFLGSHVPVVAQAPAPRIVLARTFVAPTMMTFQEVSVSTPLSAASLLLYQDPRKSLSNFRRVFAGTYERDQGMEHLSPMEEVNTLFFTQSSLPLLRFWGGRLQLDAFQSTLRIQTMPPVPLGYGSNQGFGPLRQGYPSSPRSVHLSGFSLNFYFDRDARMAHPTQAWPRLSKIVGTILN
jgi:hypothetical protein